MAEPEAPMEQQQQQLDLARAANILAKKQAQNKKKRERQKAKAKAALQQVRAAEAVGVPIADTMAAAQAAHQAAPAPDPEQQLQPVLPEDDVDEQALVIAEAAQQVNEMEHGIAHAPFRDTAAAIAGVGGQAVTTASRTDQLMKRVEMLAAAQAANKEAVSSRQQERHQQLQPGAAPAAASPPPPQQPQVRLEDLPPEEQAQELHKHAALFATSDKWEEALVAWTRATEVAPDGGEMWYYRGIASQKLERTLDAEKCWKKASKLGHTQSAGLLAGVRSKRAQEARVKADALLQSDKFDKAIGMYTAAINICPDSAEHCAACHNGKATALGLTAQWEEAKASWAEASKLDPANAGYLHYQVRPLSM